MTVAQVWDSHGLQPHRTRMFKLSRDKQFVEKLSDAVGLYLNPPGKALLLCVDAQSQSQVLDRSQPGLPMKPSRCGIRGRMIPRRSLRRWLCCMARSAGALRAPSSRSMPPLPATGGRRNASGTPFASDHRQRCHPHTAPREALTDTPAPVPPALHAAEFFLAESGRKVVRRKHPETKPPHRRGTH